MASDRRVLLANSIYHLTNDGAVTIIAGQIAVLQFAFGGFGPIEVGLLGGTALLVTAVFQFVFGVMADRRDPSGFLPIGIAILGIGSLLVTLASNFWMLLAFVAVSRIGASFYHPVGISWIAREYEGPSLDRSMGFQSAFGDTGVIIGMASGAVLGVALGWQSPFLLWGVVNLAAVVLGVRIVRGHAHPPSAAAPSSSVGDYLGVLRDVRFWLLPLALGGAVYNVFSYFGPLLLVAKFSFAKDVAGLAVALWILTGAIATFFFGRLSRRLGRYRVLLVSYAAIGVAGLVGGLVDNVVLVLAVLWTLGSGLFLTYPGLFAFVSESSHRRLQGAAFGLIFAFQLLGGAVGLFVAGVLASQLGATPERQASIPFALAGLLGFGGLAALLLARSRLTNTRKPVGSTIPPL